MRRQFHNSGPGDQCDHCDKRFGEHISGDYYCPAVANVRTLSAFHCDFGCKIPSHQPGCPFYKGVPDSTGELK